MRVQRQDIAALALFLAAAIAGAWLWTGEGPVVWLTDFAIRMNSNPLYKDFPVVAFFGYHQRKLGCFGAGNRYVYVDPNGNLHACPFCRGEVANVLEVPFPVIIEKVKSIGCHQFGNTNETPRDFRSMSAGVHKI